MLKKLVAVGKRREELVSWLSSIIMETLDLLNRILGSGAGLFSRIQKEWSNLASTTPTNSLVTEAKYHEQRLALDTVSCDCFSPIFADMASNQGQRPNLEADRPEGSLVSNDTRHLAASGAAGLHIPEAHLGKSR